MLRLSELDDFRTALRKLISYQQRGKTRLHWESSKAILGAIRAAYDFSNEFDSITDEAMRRKEIAITFLRRCDTLNLYGNRAARLRRDITGGNDVAMMVLLTAHVRGLTAGKIDGAFTNLDQTREYGIPVANYYNQMRQFIRINKQNEYDQALSHSLRPVAKRPRGRPKGIAGPTPRRTPE